MAKSKIKHILVIRLSAMGDVAMTVPVVLALTEKYPNIKITFLTKSFFTPIVSQVPNVHVFTADVRGAHKGLWGLWKLFKDLRKLEFDAVADLHNVLRSNILKTFFKASGLPVEQLDKGRKEKKELTSGKLGVLYPLMPMYLRYKLVFEKLGFDFSVSNEHIMGKGQITPNLSQNFLLKGKRTIGIAPFAAFNGKNYPLASMEALITQLNSMDAFTIALFGGGQKEGELLGVWEQNFSNCISAVGKLSFNEELCLISNLDLMISMDSGNGHLAAMYGVPVITLWGVTHPSAGFVPFGQPENNQITSDRNLYPLIPTSVYGNKFPQGYEKVMETIAPEQIMLRVRQILEEN